VHRELSARLEVCLVAARREEYGNVQREALQDGALLVTVPSVGMLSLLTLARRLDARLVAHEISAYALAECVRCVVTMSSEERAAYRARARDVLRPYTRDRFEQTLHERVLPALLQAAPLRPPE
jgi:hypothetical protein